MSKKRVKLAILLVMLLVLALVPVIPGVSSEWIGWLTTVWILGILGMSYDLLLGYTGIVSFGHALYFGIGAYATGIFLSQKSSSIQMILGMVVGILLAVVCSVGIGYLSLRVKSTYFAMITLAFAQLAYVISRSQGLRHLLGGDDGMNLSLPDGLNSRWLYVISGVAVLGVYLLLRRAVNSPWGHVLVAVRDNEIRIASQGYSVLQIKLSSMALSGGLAALSGGLFAIAQAFVNPDAAFGLDKSIDPLLMVMIGGAGTLVGPLLGAVVIYGAQQVLTSYTSEFPFLEHWYILFGILYILIVLFLPGGILNARKLRSTKKIKSLGT